MALLSVLWPSQDSVAAEPGVDDRYTLFVELQEPHGSNRATLQKMLKAEGYELFPEGEREITLVLTAGQIAKLFQAKVRTHVVEKSATSGTAAQPFLEGVRIPARYQKLIRRVYFDPQRS